jgi:hypothetical protein
VCRGRRKSRFGRGFPGRRLRHSFRAAFPVHGLPRGVLHRPLVAGLIPGTGPMKGLLPTNLRARARAVLVPTVAAGAGDHLRLAPRAVEEPEGNCDRRIRPRDSTGSTAQAMLTRGSSSRSRDLPSGAWSSRSRPPPRGTRSLRLRRCTRAARPHLRPQRQAPPPASAGGRVEPPGQPQRLRHRHRSRPPDHDNRRRRGAGYGHRSACRGLWTVYGRPLARPPTARPQSPGQPHERRGEAIPGRGVVRRPLRRCPQPRRRFPGIDG